MKLMAVFLGAMGGLVMAGGMEHNDPSLLWCSFVMALIAGALA